VSGRAAGPGRFRQLSRTVMGLVSAGTVGVAIVATLLSAPGTATGAATRSATAALASTASASISSPTTTPAAGPTPTSLAPIGDHLPVAPATVPLRTRTQSAHVSSIFAALSGVGFFIAAVMVVTRLILTRSGRRR
jgi:hypothetical protein